MRNVLINSLGVLFDESITSEINNIMNASDIMPAEMKERLALILLRSGVNAEDCTVLVNKLTADYIQLKEHTSALLQIIKSYPDTTTKHRNLKNEFMRLMGYTEVEPSESQLELITKMATDLSEINYHYELRKEIENRCILLLPESSENTEEMVKLVLEHLNWGKMFTQKQGEAINNLRENIAQIDQSLEGFPDLYWTHVFATLAYRSGNEITQLHESCDDNKIKDKLDKVKNYLSDYSLVDDDPSNVFIIETNENKELLLNVTELASLNPINPSDSNGFYVCDGPNSQSIDAEMLRGLKLSRGLYNLMSSKFSAANIIADILSNALAAQITKQGVNLAVEDGVTLRSLILQTVLNPGTTVNANNRYNVFNQNLMKLLNPEVKEVAQTGEYNVDHYGNDAVMKLGKSLTDHYRMEHRNKLKVYGVDIPDDAMVGKFEYLNQLKQYTNFDENVYNKLFAENVPKVSFSRILDSMKRPNFAQEVCSASEKFDLVSQMEAQLVAPLLSKLQQLSRLENIKPQELYYTLGSLLLGISSIQVLGYETSGGVNVSVARYRFLGAYFLAKSVSDNSNGWSPETIGKITDIIMAAITTDWCAGILFNRLYGVYTDLRLKMPEAEMHRILTTRLS